jgi:hypothetical protein
MPIFSQNLPVHISCPQMCPIMCVRVTERNDHADMDSFYLPSLFSVSLIYSIIQGRNILCCFKAQNICVINTATSHTSRFHVDSVCNG